MVFKSTKEEQITDAELIERFRNSHDTRWVGKLFQRYVHLLFGLCIKYLGDQEEAKDAVMDLFEKMVTELKRHRVRNFRPWVYSMAKNYCLMKLRSRKAKISHEEEYKYFWLDFMENEDVDHLSIEDQKEEMEQKVREGIEQLKPHQRTCIDLFYIQNKSYKEIASLTGYELKQVKSYVQNGRRNLKILLKNNDED